MKELTKAHATILCSDGKDRSGWYNRQRKCTQLAWEDGMAYDMTKFIYHVHLFYAKFVKTMIKKFPLKSPLLSDLRILNPEE